MDLKYDRVLGTGSYGVVYSATAPRANIEGEGEGSVPIAVKRMVKEDAIMGCASLCEFDTLAAGCGHPFIVKTLTIIDSLLPPDDASTADESNVSSPMRRRGVARTMRKKLSPLREHDFPENFIENPYHPVFELADMDLDDFVKRHPGAPLSHRLRLFFHFLCGLEWLHGRHIIHRDIKPINMLIFQDPDHPGDTSRMTLKVADMGMVRHHVAAFPSSPGGYTTGYRSPEVILECDDYDYAADLWAAGALLFFMLFTREFVDSGIEDEDEILTEILEQHEDTLTDIQEFYDMYETARDDCMTLDCLPYESEGGATMGKMPSRGPLAASLRARRVDLEEEMRAVYGDSEDSQLIDTALAILRSCLALNPRDRPSVEELLDDHIEAFERVEPGAGEVRRAAREFTLDESGWDSVDPVPGEYEDAHARVLQFARELADSEDTSKNFLEKPNILIHALRAIERLYLWMAWVKGADPDEEDGPTDEMRQIAAALDADKPEVLYVIAIYIFYKCFVTLKFVSFENLVDDIELTHPEVAEAARHAFYMDRDAGGLSSLSGGKACSRAELVERVMLLHLYSFCVVTRTQWEEVVSRLEDHEAIFDPLTVTRVVLKRYHELKTDEDLDALIADRMNELVGSE